MPLFKKERFIFMYISVFACMYAWCLQTSGEGIRSPRTGVTIVEPLCGYWKLIPGPLEEQPVVFTAESSLQHPQPFLLQM